MTWLNRSARLILLAAAVVVPVRGSAQQPRRPVPPIPPAQIAANLKRAADAGTARFNAEKQQKRDLAARQVRAAAISAASRLARERARIRVDTTLPSIDTVVTAAGGADPRSLIVILGSKLYVPASGPGEEVHVVIAGKDLLANNLSSTAKVDRLEAIMPEFEGIAGPTPAQVYVTTRYGKSAPRAITVKPELVQLHLDLAALKSALIADSHGTKLTYDETGKAADYFNVHDATTIEGSHTAPPGSAPASGTDYYFSSYQLKNNWVVRQLVWYNPVDYGAPGQSSANPTIQSGASALATKIEWWRNESSANRAFFYFGYLIEGPRGVAYR